MGKVYLIGAGPGEKSLLTLKAYELIKKADVVVYDRLVGEDIMDLIPNTAKKINVGKNVGNHAVPQEEINKILAEQGLKENIVVRLKGGDPFVFGRGGEELEELVACGVDYEVVPGITSSISAPMYGGIPVTHRDFCSSFHVITGHAKKDGKLNIDYASLVKLNGTLIFMMSVSSSTEIAKGLINSGMSETMPFAFIENATRPYQRKFVGELSKIEDVINENKICSPAVFIVGKVCNLNFDWFSKKPLKNKKILVTSPNRNSSELVSSFKENGAVVKWMPMIETADIRPLDIEIDNFDTLVFTSSAGVSSFFDDMFSKGMDARKVYNKRFACVGEKTAATLKNYGIIADFIPSYFDGETLAKEMIEKSFIDKSNKVLLLRAKEATEDIVKILSENGIDFKDFPVYKTEKLTYEKSDLAEIELVTFTSKSCVKGFKENFSDCNFENITAVCIGKQTASLAKELGFKTYISEKATTASMIEKVLEICS